ncbi:MAG: hypothetical protein ACFFCQ_08030 [Promethearchaeota archaeon]
MSSSTKNYCYKFRLRKKSSTCRPLAVRRIFIHRNAEILKTRHSSLQNLVKKMDRHYVEGFNRLVAVVSKMEDNLLEQMQSFMENTELSIRLLADRLTEEPALVDEFENPERLRDLL